MDDFEESVHWDWQRRSKVSAGETDCLKLNMSSRVKKPKKKKSKELSVFTVPTGPPQLFRVLLSLFNSH